MRVDGGMAANDWLCQFLADVLAVPVQRPRNVEATALGAACLAGLGVGLWPGLDKLPDSCTGADTFRPMMDGDQRDGLVAGWRDAVRRTLSALSP
jgi:glycerol kinase